jgi:hypothetical protein
MSSTALGRLCLAVLDEGQARALVELASAVYREIAGGAAAASTYVRVNSPAPNTSDDG